MIKESRWQNGYHLPFYRPQRSWAKVIFLQACVKNCPQGEGGGCLPQCMLGYTPPGPGTPPWSRPPKAEPPRPSTPPGADTPPPTRPGTHPPPGPGTPPPQPGTPPLEQTPPRPGTHTRGADPPPGKQTAVYGQRAAGTHPTGMHSCLWQVFTKVQGFSATVTWHSEAVSAFTVLVIFFCSTV